MRYIYNVKISMDIEIEAGHITEASNILEELIREDYGYDVDYDYDLMEVEENEN